MLNVECHNERLLFIASRNNRQKLEVEISPYGFSKCEIQKSIINCQNRSIHIIRALLIQKLEGSVCPPPTQAVLLYYGNNQPKNVHLQSSQQKADLRYFYGTIVVVSSILSKHVETWCTLSYNVD
jgi:hypothetical protein